MEVYIELVYLVNMIIIVISVQMMTILLNTQVTYKKALGIAFLLNYSIIMLYIDHSYYLLLVGWFITFAALYKKQVFLYYPVFLFIYYSIIYFLQSLIPEAYIYQGIIIMPIRFTSLTMGVFAILLATIQVVFIVYSKKKITESTFHFPIQIRYQEETITCDGFLDSGNEVYYLGYPLVLVNKKKIPEYEALDTIIVDNIAGVIVDVIQVEKMYINNQELEDVYIGIIENIKYDCLLHKHLMGGII